MSRILRLNQHSPVEGECVVYVMSRDQRVHDNHALLEAQSAALELKLPLVVVFNLLPKTGHRAREHYQFMIDGLKQVEAELKKQNIAFVLLIGDPRFELTKLFDEIKPSQVFFDFNPLRGPRQLQKHVASQVDFSVSVVDTHNIVPVWVTSDKEEYAAHTIRNKIHLQLEKWLVEPTALKKQPEMLQIDGKTWKQAEEAIRGIKSNGSEIQFSSGEAAAKKELASFIDDRLDDYAEMRNVPTIEVQSNLSPYLHYGQISALRVALELVEQASEPPLLFRQGKLAKFEGKATRLDSINALLEEMIIRKELADNYCFYNPNYDSLEGAKDWAKASLEEHKSDEREHIYSLADLEAAETHDEAWNAAQKQMAKSGKMHGYMRMYWAKKILEWSKSPKEAIKHATYLNDHYSLDGGDPNGYTGIMWSIAGVHDRPWFEREVFGKIRYMNRGGLERRFDVDEYIDRWHE